MADRDPSQSRPLSGANLMWIGLGVLVLFGISVAAAIRWLPDPSPGWVNASSYGVGVWGLLISVVGFGITLWQLNITKRAAEAASDAADSARIRLNAFNALRECETGKRQLDLIYAEIQREKWESIVDLAQPLAGSLIGLRESNANFDEKVTVSINQAIIILEKNCATIDRAISIDTSKLSKAKQFSAFRPIEQALMLVFFNIERLS